MYIQFELKYVACIFFNKTLGIWGSHNARSFFLMFFLKDSIFEEPRTRNATKMHRRQFCYMSIVFGGPPEILPMKSWLYFFFFSIPFYTSICWCNSSSGWGYKIVCNFPDIHVGSFSLVATFQKCLRSSAFSLG